MKLKIYLTLLIFCNLGSLNAQPVITAFSPFAAEIGSTVNIQGSGFDPIASNNFVYFGAVRATIVSGTTSNLNVIVPSGAMCEPITVVSNGLSTNSFNRFIPIFQNGGTLNTSSFVTPPINFASGNLPNGVLTADFDGDGKPDVAVANTNEKTITIHKNNSIGTTISFSLVLSLNTGIFSGPFRIFAKDMNCDGKLDIVGDGIGGSISYFPNTSANGQISFSSYIKLSNNIDGTYFTLNDLNNDGKPDIITCDPSANLIYIYRNISTANNIIFQTPGIALTVGRSPKQNYAVDLDKDNKLDLVVTNGIDGTISILRNTSVNGDISFAPKIDYIVSAEFKAPASINSADFDSDDNTDLAIGVVNTSTLVILKNLSSPGIINFATPANYNSIISPTTVNINDLDGDGKVDICVGNGIYPGRITLLKNISSNSGIAFSPKIEYILNDGTNEYISICDLNGDNKPDIVANSQQEGNFIVLKNNVQPCTPDITGFSPVSTFSGNSVLIKGKNFYSTTGISFGGVPAASFIVTSDTTITAILGVGASGNLIVTNACGSDTLGGFSYLLPSASISGNASVCKNSPSPQIIFSASNGIKPFIFTYSINNGTTLTAQSTNGNIAAVNVPTTSPGRFVYKLLSVRDSLSYARTLSDSAVVTVTELPIITATAGKITCKGGSTTVTVSATGGTPPYIGTGTYTKTAGTYSFSVTDANNCTVNTNPITIADGKQNTPARPGPISGPINNVCGGFYTYTINAVTGATSYIWIVPAGCTIVTNNGTSITITSSTSFSSGVISVAANNSCGSGTARTLTINGIPAKPTISGPACVSSGQSNLIYSVINPTANINYQWSITGGGSIVSGQGTSSITVNWGSRNGRVTVTASNSCGTSSVGLLNVAIGCSVNASLKIKSDVSNSNFTEINVSPNPAHESITLGFYMMSSSNATISIFNSAGVKVKEINPHWYQKGDNSVEINLEALTIGEYLIVLTTNSETVQKRFLKL